MSQLIIIDYDDTYTIDKELWDMFIIKALANKHIVVCCTMRIEGLGNEDVTEDMAKHNVPIVYSAEFDSKFSAMKEAGYEPLNAIWIDDRPMFIFTSKDYNDLNKNDRIGII